MAIFKKEYSLEKTTALVKKNNQGDGLLSRSVATIETLSGYVTRET